MWIGEKNKFFVYTRKNTESTLKSTSKSNLILLLINNLQKKKYN
jgi:hypothetical protein